ncbi:MAG TPA: adenylate/guanylate cyclase domain-containing protein [Parafilimonas sp.]|nr:adenylate/guanylate cyclase domain-containing protein [Parafilimonas sp.]
MPASHQLAAILFTDIVSYTAIMQHDEEKARIIIKRHNSVLEKIVAAHHGEVLNYYGDGSLCIFSSATESVRCAIEIQKELQTEPIVPLRIGLHVGEVFFEDRKALGDGVNIASRIQSLGQANTVLFSKEIFDKIRNHSEFKAVSLGHFDFKNVDDSIEVFALTNEGLAVPKREKMEGKVKEVKNKNTIRRNFIITVSMLLLLFVGYFFYVRSSEQKSAGAEKSIAVLPFKNISINKAQNEPFCIGVALELQKKLQLLGGLIPIASQSVEKYRDTKLSIRDIANELGGVKYIVQGNVLRDKDKVKVFVSLIDVASDKEIWSDDFPGEVKDFFSLQENIAQRIASEVQVKITPDEQSRINRIATENAAAIDAYNEALTAYVTLVSAVHPLYWDSLPSDPKLYSDYLNTLSLCDNAINADPSMAEAYVLKGQTFIYRISSWAASGSEVTLISDSGRALANKALAIDQSSADAFLLLWSSAAVSGDSAARYYLDRAYSINPNNFDVNRALGERYGWYDPEKAIRFCKKAIRLNPVSLLTPSVYSSLAFTYHTCGDFEKAEQYAKKAVVLANANTMIETEAIRNLTIIYLHWGKADSVIKYANLYVKQEPNALYEIAEASCNLKNDCSKAAAMYDTLWQRYPNRNNPHRWAVALFNSGRIKEGEEKIALADKEYKARHDTLGYDYAGICAFKGDKETALRILRQWKWSWGSPYLIQRDKLFDNIRNDKEFRDIVRKAVDDKARVREKIDKLEEEGKL